MEIIGIILAILFALITAGDRKKKAAKNAGQPGMPARGTAAQAASLRASVQADMPPSAAKPATAARPQAVGVVKPAAPATPTVVSSEDFEDVLAELKQRLVVQAAPAAAQGESMLSDAECAGGSMPHDHAEGTGALEDAECAGGSMDHAHTEGVSRAAQARRMAAMDREEQAHGNTALPKTIDSHALRRAVVMAEVLGRPRALRGAGR